MVELRRCAACNAYMIGEACPQCGEKKHVSVKPPKYSVEDRYAKYRRMAKEQNDGVL